MKSVVRAEIFFSFLFSAVLLLSCMSTGNKHSKIIDNTFCVDILNTSRFEIEIDSQRSMPEKNIRHNLPLHESALYDGWNVTYRIPISENVFYIHSEKTTVADKQDVLKIKNPKAISETESYILIQNDSASSIQITSTGSNYLPIFLEGQINGISPSNDYYIPSGKSGVVKAKAMTSLFIKNDDGIHTIFKNKPLQSSTVYTFSFDGNAIRLTDKRPLASVLEPTCGCTIPKSISVCNLLQHPASGELYFVGTEEVRDSRGFPFLRGAAGKIVISGESDAEENFIRYAPFEAGGDVQFFDAAFSDGGGLVAAGQISVEEPCGIIVRYTADGAVADCTAAEGTVALGAICRADGSSFFAAGIDSGGAVVVMSVSCGTEIAFRKISSVEMPDGTAADGAVLCYSAAEGCVLLAVNIVGDGGFSPSRLYTIPANGGTAQEISLREKIGAVSSIILNKNGGVFLTGETPAGATTAACVLSAQTDGTSCETKFISSESPSWISDAWIDADSGELVVCGMTACGKKRVPFLRAFDVQHFQPAWEKTYSDSAFSGLNDAAFVLPCTDWGFFVGMSALDADNRRRAPFSVVHVTSSGNISEHHKTIQLQGTVK